MISLVVVLFSVCLSYYKMVHKDVFWHFSNISGMCVQWWMQLILVRYWSLRCPSACFQRIQDIDWIHRKLDAWTPNSLPYYVYHRCSFTPNLKTKGVPGLPGYWKDVPSSKPNFYRGPFEFMAPSTWTFNSWRCAKGKDVKLQSSYPEEGVIQTDKEMTVFFFFSSITINTFNSLAERQAKFKIVHIWKWFHTLC